AETGHLTGWSGRGSGTVPVPARAEAQADSSGVAPRAAAAALAPRKERRVSFLGTPWPCQPSRGCDIGQPSPVSCGPEPCGLGPCGLGSCGASGFLGALRALGSEP